MRILTKEQETLLEHYLQQADGDIDLVNEAMLKYNVPSDPIDQNLAHAEGIIRYIVKHKESTMPDNFIGLWVDDLRPLPSDLVEAGWSSAPTFHEAVLKLELMEFKEVSLDHDLGCYYGMREMTGYDILMWLVDRKVNGLFVPPAVYVHSANPVGRQKMQETIDRYWK